MIQLPVDTSTYINTKKLLMVIYTLQRLILPKIFLPLEKTAANTSIASKTTQYISGETLLDEASRGELAAEASFGSPPE